MANKRVCAYIKLENIKKNVDAVKRHLKPSTKVLAVVKADAYGHGAVPIAKYLETAVWGFAVATVSEGVELRTAGLKKPILVLGYSFSDEISDVLKNDLSITVFSYKTAFEISKYASSLRKTVKMHIKLDTGMGRIGFECSDRAIDDIEKISRLPAVTIEGIFTHFSKSDETDRSFTEKQFEKFSRMVESLEERGVDVGLKHCANSAAIIDYPQMQLDMVRLGVALYGMWPSDEVSRDAVNLLPAMSIESHVTHVKKVPAGTPISYGGTFVTERESIIATVPVGYGDGYARSLSGKGKVLINGEFVPIVGRVCMDQFMIDATDLNVNVGDRVVLLGKDGDFSITMEDLGRMSGRFNYEFACDINQRVPRVY
ncbi:MAG: alanine racemase [Lachnospiraceae bacterium]|nr:alanine racemase [Lachnospiraceae bacterium]